MRGVKFILFGISLLLIQGLQAQIFADFETVETIPEFSAEGESKVVVNPELNDINATANTAYYDKISGNWHYVTILFPDTIFIEKNNTLQFLSHCSTQGRIYAKLWKGDKVIDEDWAHEYNSMPPANQWVALAKDITHLRGEWFTKLEIAFCVDNEVQASVYFDELSLAKLTKKTALYYSVEAGNAMLAAMVEGTELGQFPTGSKSEVEAALVIADSILKIQDDVSMSYADSAAFDMNNTLTMVESRSIRNSNNLIDSLVSFQTINLYLNLNTIADSKHQLFGSHDATAYGINEDGTTWSDDGSASKSDLKEVTGSHGAISSYDASEIVGNTFTENVNYRNRLVANYEEGGVNTICWHMSDPKYGKFYWEDIEAAGAYNVVASINEGGEYHGWYRTQLYTLASFAKGLRGSKGEAIPVIFRPFHEQTGAWFWWGKTRCSTEEYNQLWQFTIDYLRDTLDVHNFIYAYSPDASTMSDVSGYFQIYPGDEYTDIFGLDYYFNGGETEEDHLTQMLSDIVGLAKQKNKIAALTETGNDQILPNTWYVNSLLSAIHGSDLSKQIAYYATWRNGGTEHFYVPYPGHASVPSFMQFYDDTTTLFLNDMLAVYEIILADEVRLPSSGSRLNEFGFDNDEGTQITDTNVWVLMDYITDLSDLAALFTASQGASVKVGEVMQHSAETSNDFSSEVIYTVVSESGVNSSEYLVKVDFSELQKMSISPSSARLSIGESKQYVATGYNQLEIEMLVDPEWTATGGGSLNSDGLFTASEEGNFEVTASQDEISAAAVVKVRADETGIEQGRSNKIKVYPNPSNGNIYVENDHLTIHTVQVLNFAGQQLISFPYEDLIVGKNTIYLNLASQPNGVYFIQLIGDEGVLVNKIVKQ